MWQLPVACHISPPRAPVIKSNTTNQVAIGGRDVKFAVRMFWKAGSRNELNDLARNHRNASKGLNKQGTEPEEKIFRSSLEKYSGYFGTPNECLPDIIRPKAHCNRKPQLSTHSRTHTARYLMLSRPPKHKTAQDDSYQPDPRPAHARTKKSLSILQSGLNSTKQAISLAQIPLPPRQFLLLHHRRWRLRPVFILIPTIRISLHHLRTSPIVWPQAQLPRAHPQNINIRSTR